MKRIVATICSVALLAALTVTAYADSDTMTALGDKEIDVQAKYVDEKAYPTVYSVDVEWGAMQFTYTESGDNTWNPDTHKYTLSLSTEWTASGNTVKVTNHSNKAVKTAFAYESLEAFSTVTGTFDVTEKDLAAGEVDSYDSADSVETKLTIGGTLAETNTEFTKIGKITVSLS